MAWVYFKGQGDLVSMFMPPTSHVTMPVLLTMKVLPESPDLPGRIEGLGRAGQAVFFFFFREIYSATP